MIRILLLILIFSMHLSAQKSFISSFDGERLAYYDEGQGFPVILIHGFINTADSWKESAVRKQLLSAGYRVIIPDLRGNGDSSMSENPEAYESLAQTKDLIHLMNYLGIHEYHAVGYSRGSIVLAKLLTIEDERIQKAVIGGMGIDFADPNWEIPKAFAAGFRGDLENYPIAQGAVDYAKSINANLITLSLQQAFQPTTTRQELIEIKTSVLLLNGDQDEWNGSKEALHKALPNSTLKLVPGDHNTTYRKEAFANEVLEFLSSTSAKHLFYLHGSILEGETRNTISPEFGEYQYDQIIDRFKTSGFIIHSELREAETSVDLYSDKIITDIEDLLSKGISAADIFIVGASKGALIGMLVATKYENPAISYVFMGNCNQWVADHYALNLHGNILSIYEESDEVGGESCEVMKAISPDMHSYKEIKLNTGLNHGFLYKPLDDWMLPIIDFIKS